LHDVPYSKKSFLITMYHHIFKKRVRYAETDKMGYLYYGNYAKYYEIGRVEAMRSLGTSYYLMEEELKVMLPVLHMETRFLLPAYYDEELEIHTILESMPSKMITFKHEIKNTKQKTINEATIKLFFVDMINNKRTSVPDVLKEKLKPYF